MKRNAATFLCATILVSVAVARANYNNPPDWDRQDPTFTHQEWNFPNSNPKPPADVDENPFGEPTGRVGMAHFNGQDWWCFLSDAERSMGFTIPNEQDLSKVKLVWLSIHFDKSGGVDPAVGDFLVHCDTRGSEQVTLLSEQVVYDGGWYYEAMWEIDPQPDEEEVGFSFGGASEDTPLTTATIYQVNIDTVCVPEPASACLLVGIAGVLIRRRKS